MDLVLQVVLTEANVPDAPGKWRRGDVVQVYPSEAIKEKPAPGSRLGFVFLTNAPYATIEEARTDLVRERHFGGDPDGALLGRSQWKLDETALPTRDGEASATWQSQRSKIRNVDTQETK